MWADSSRLPLLPRRPSPWCEILLLVSTSYIAKRRIQITYIFIIFIYDWAQYLGTRPKALFCWNNRAAGFALPSFGGASSRGCLVRSTIKNSLSFCYDWMTFIIIMSRVKRLLSLSTTCRFGRLPLVVRHSTRLCLCEDASSSTTTQFDYDDDRLTFPSSRNELHTSH